jgi:hypothetical protein
MQDDAYLCDAASQGLSTSPPPEKEGQCMLLA